MARGEDSLDNSEALNRFLASIERRAFRMAEYATGNREDALDLVQDAMTKLAIKYAEKDPADWAPLFYRILQNHIRDFHRRTKLRNGIMKLFRRPAPDEDNENGGEQYPARASVRPDNQTFDLELLEQLEPALRGLPVRQQQVFLLRAWEGFDVRKTAIAMGCGQGSVKTHYSRAVHALRKQLGDFDGGFDE